MGTGETAKEYVCVVEGGGGNSVQQADAMLGWQTSPSRPDTHFPQARGKFPHILLSSKIFRPPT